MSPAGWATVAVVWSFLVGVGGITLGVTAGLAARRAHVPASDEVEAHAAALRASQAGGHTPEDRRAL